MMRKQWSIARFLLFALLLRAFAPLLGELTASPSAVSPFLGDLCSAAQTIDHPEQRDGGAPATSHARGDHCVLCGGVGMVPPSAEFRLATRASGIVALAESLAAGSPPSTYAGFQFLATAPPRA
jgi:hypothetical protein